LNTKAKTSAHVVLGLDKEGKPRAALIHPNDLEAATKAAVSLGFKIGRADSPQVLSMAKQLPDAKVFATGNGLVPLCRNDIFEWLKKGLTPVETKTEASGPKAETAADVRTGSDAADTASHTGKVGDAGKVDPVKLDAKLWDQLTVGTIVIAPDKNPIDNGYWPAVITAVSKDGQKLTVRWRDAPKLPPVTVKRRAVALALLLGQS